jgi:hypothetical protein
MDGASQTELTRSLDSIFCFLRKTGEAFLPSFYPDLNRVTK